MGTTAKIKQDSLASIRKKPAKTLSKKKQRALTKSAKVMMEKMDVNTTEDDILNIMKSMETQTDTKATANDLENDSVHQIRKEQGLQGLKSDKLKNDLAKDVKTSDQLKKVQSDIAQQLKLIDEFTL